MESRDGGAAVEFAIVAAPFFALLLGIIEVSLIYFGSLTLENAMLEAAREIRTGQLQTSGGTESDFKTALCAHTSTLVGCNGSLHVDVRVFQQFGNTNFPNPIDNGEIATNFQFDPGGAGDVVLVRAFYIWDVKSLLMGQLLENMNNGRRLLSASAAFRNEPFNGS